MAGSGHMKTLKEMKDAFFCSIEKIYYPEVCIQCHQRFYGGYKGSTKEGFKLLFCTNECGHAYWDEYGQFGRNPVVYEQSGPRICRYPDCNKPCFIEGKLVHDYCGRTHAREHGAISGSGKGGGGWWCGGGGTTGYRRQNSGGSNGSQSSPTFTSGVRNHTGPIRFYNRGEPYYEFTNFYEAVVKIDGEDWLTTEHYFQAQKFVGTPLVGTIRMLERPREAFEKSRDPRYSPWRRSDWEKVKEDVMYKALQAKFTQHEDLGQSLRETRDRYLIEHSPYDSYWGDGGDGSGKNRLGVLLMRLRKDMKPKQPIRAPSPPAPIHPQPDSSPERDFSKQEGLAPQPSPPQPTREGQQQNNSLPHCKSKIPDSNIHRPIVQVSVSSTNTQPHTSTSMSCTSVVTPPSRDAVNSMTNPASQHVPVNTSAVPTAMGQHVPVNTSAVPTAMGQHVPVNTSVVPTAMGQHVPVNTSVVPTAMGQMNNLASTSSAPGLKSSGDPADLMGDYSLSLATAGTEQYTRAALHSNRPTEPSPSGEQPTSSQCGQQPSPESPDDESVPMEH